MGQVWLSKIIVGGYYPSDDEIAEAVREQRGMEVVEVSHMTSPIWIEPDTYEIDSLELFVEPMPIES